MRLDQLPALELVDPRGRCNRKGLLIVACILLALELLAGLAMAAGLVPLGSPAAWMLKAAFVWMAIAGAVRRLHDVGMSGWRILCAIVALSVWCFVFTTAAAIALGPENLVPGTAGFLAVFGALMAPVLMLALWLHVAPGDPRPNRYGPVPDGLGFSRQPRDVAPAIPAHAG